MQQFERRTTEGAGAVEPWTQGDRRLSPIFDPVGRQERTERIRRRARALGWLSLGIGLVEIAAGTAFSRLFAFGKRRHAKAALLYSGARQITVGLGILTGTRPVAWIWGRLLGDVMDVALLGAARATPSRDFKGLSAASVALAGVAVLDGWTALELGWERHLGEHGVRIKAAITVNRSPEVVYRFWQANAPVGTTLEWEADVLIDQPNQFIAWRSRRGADVPNQGLVRFVRAPGGRGTELRLELEYEPPGGVASAALAKLFGKNPDRQIGRDLRRFKQLLEIDEVLLSDASLHRGRHPARPSEEPDLSRQKRVKS